MNNDCSCKNCKERHVNCHSECEDYIKWNKIHVEERENIHKRKELTGQLNAAVKEGKKRMQTRRAKKYAY